MCSSLHSYMRKIKPSALPGGIFLPTYREAEARTASRVVFGKGPRLGLGEFRADRAETARSLSVMNKGAEGAATYNLPKQPNLAPQNGTVPGVFDPLSNDQDSVVYYKDKGLSRSESSRRRSLRSTIVLLSCYHGAIGWTAGIPYASSDPR